MSKQCKEHKLSYETLEHLKNHTRLRGDGLLRPHARLLHIRHTGRRHRLLYGKLSRRIVQTSRPTHGSEVLMLLFLPSCRSVHPTPSRAVAQPRRAHPALVYKHATHATKILATLPAQLAMERRPITPVHGLLLTFYRQLRRNSTPARQRRVPTRPPHARTQPREGPLGAYTNLRAPRPLDRHYNLYLLSPSFETTHHCYPLLDHVNS
jgi:hypothetical protein